MLKICYCKKFFELNFLNNGKFASYFSQIGSRYTNIKIKNDKSSFSSISLQLKYHSMNNEYLSDYQYKQYQVNKINTFLYNK